MQFYHGNKPLDVQSSNLHFNILLLKCLPFSGGTQELRKSHTKKHTSTTSTSVTALLQSKKTQ